MTTERELRDVLYYFGIGFYLRENKNYDVLELMPTTKSHIANIPLDELLKVCLTKKEFETWKTEAKP